MKFFDKMKKNAPQQKPVEQSMFLTFVLFDRMDFDSTKLLSQLKNDWGIELSGISENEGKLIGEYDQMAVIFAHMPVPVPEGEAENAAKFNLAWEDAKCVAKAHKSHAIISVRSVKKPKKTAAALLSKVCTSCLKCEGATAVYTGSTVLAPGYYISNAEAPLSKGKFPTLTHVNLSAYSKDENVTVSCYTSGLEKFGKRNFHVSTAADNAKKLFDTVLELTEYIIENDITLKDGETVEPAIARKLGIANASGFVYEEDFITFVL